MVKIDLRKELRHLYSPSAKQPKILEVPEQKCLVVDGAGHPEGSQEFQSVVGALFTAAYTAKFRAKKELGVDYPVMPLEGLWLPGVDPARAQPQDWKWTLFIVVSDSIDDSFLADSLAEARKKRPDLPLDRVEVRTIHEGLCAQVMHVGPYSEDGPTIEALHRFIAERGYSPNGPHHEIYLGDPRRADPKKLKTIIRLPVANS